MKRVGIIGTGIGLVMAAALAIGVAGCQTGNPKDYHGEDVVIQLVAVGGALAYLDESYDSIVDVVGRANFNDNEKAVLNQTKSAVDRSRGTLRELAKSDVVDAYVTLSSEQAKVTYNDLKTAYVNARGVVIDHRADYSAADYQRLIDLNATVIQLDKDVRAIWDAKERVDEKWQAALLAAAQNTRDILRLMRESRH